MLRNIFSHPPKKKTLAQELLELIERDEKIRDESASPLERVIYDANNAQKRAAEKLLDDLGGIDVHYALDELIAADKGELCDILKRHHESLPAMFVCQRDAIPEEQLDLYQSVLNIGKSL